MYMLYAYALQSDNVKAIDIILSIPTFKCFFIVKW